MKPVGNYNKISPELQAKIPKLEKSVTFKMLEGIKNNDPDPIERQKQPIFYSKQNIPMRDRIFDEFVKDENGNQVGAWVDIVVADGWNKNEPTRERLFFPFEPSTVFSGKFTLNAGNAKDAEIYEFLMLCNENSEAVTGDKRDTSVHPRFCVMNIQKESTATRGKIDEIRQALTLTKDLSYAQAKSIANALNWNTYTDEGELLAKVEYFAREKPGEFLKVYNDPSKEFKAEIKEALTSGVATFDMQTGQFKIGTQVITTLPTKDRTDVVNYMGNWFSTAPNGADVFALIQKQNKDKNMPTIAETEQITISEADTKAQANVLAGLNKTVTQPTEVLETV